MAKFALLIAVGQFDSGDLARTYALTGNTK
jgi:hypothetical protein